MMEAGANIHARDPHGYSIMDYAVFHGIVPVVDELIKRGVTQNAEENLKHAEEILTRDKNIIKSFLNISEFDHLIDNSDDLATTIQNIFTREQQIELMQYNKNYYQEMGTEAPILVTHHACANDLTYLAADCSLLGEDVNVVEISYSIE